MITIQYLSKFLPCLCDVAKRLRELTQKETIWVWECYALYMYFAPYVYGMACTRTGYPIHGLLTCPIRIWESHTHIGAHTAYGQPKS